jgi:hypothetical protein
VTCAGCFSVVSAALEFQTKGTEMKLTGIRNAALQRPLALAMFFILLSVGGYGAVGQGFNQPSGGCSDTCTFTGVTTLGSTGTGNSRFDGSSALATWIGYYQTGERARVKLGDGSGKDISLDAGGNPASGTGLINLVAKATKLQAMTVSTLPTPAAGLISYVTDGDSGLALGATVVNSGAGATKYLVWYNGSNWTVYGK